MMMCIILYILVLSAMCRCLFAYARVKAMEHEGTGEQSPYQCVHLMLHLVTMSLDMGELTDLLGQILSNVNITRALSVMWKGSTPIR